MRNTFVDFQLMLAVKTCPGWQPGIEGTAADLDEDWDKFEDEGIVYKNVNFILVGVWIDGFTMSLTFIGGLD